MKKVIELTQNQIIRLFNEPFLLPDNLEIELNSNVYRLDTLIIHVRNGNKTGKFKITESGKAFDLKEFLFAGKLEIKIEMFVRGELAKSWTVEPIFIKELESNFEIIPEIAKMEAEISKMKGAIKDIIKLLKKESEM